MAVFITGGQAAKHVNYVEYIQSNGTQFIDTRFKPNNNTRVVMDMQGATTTSGVYMHYGTVSGSLNFMAGKAASASWDLYAYYNTTEQKLATKTVSDFAVRTVFDQNKNAITVGGVSYTFAAASFSLSHTMYLFGVNSNGSASFLSPIKLYSCQIYDNGTLVRDFWPCYDPDGVACLYDKVEKKYYYNAGTGAFTTEEPPATPIAVTITGKGDSRKCYAIINGTKQYTAGTHEVYAGDTITFGVVGRGFPNYGSVIINKTEVLIVTESTAKTYDWTVPNGISTVEIAMVYSKNGVGQITVTTA